MLGCICRGICPRKEKKLGAVQRDAIVAIVSRILSHAWAFLGPFFSYPKTHAIHSAILQQGAKIKEWSSCYIYSACAAVCLSHIIIIIAVSRSTAFAYLTRPLAILRHPTFSFLFHFKYSYKNVATWPESKTQLVNKQKLRERHYTRIFLHDDLELRRGVSLRKDLVSLEPQESMIANEVLNNSSQFCLCIMCSIKATIRSLPQSYRRS